MIDPTYRLVFACAMDNHEPIPRRVVHGTLGVYLQNDERARSGEFSLTVELLPSENSSIEDADIDSYIGPLAKMRKAVYLIDDGRRVRPFYVSSWHDGHASPAYPNGTYPKVWLREFPTNDANPHQFFDWLIGPSTVYHIKVEGELRYS